MPKRRECLEDGGSAATAWRWAHHQKPRDPRCAFQDGMTSKRKKGLACSWVSQFSISRFLNFHHLLGLVVSTKKIQPTCRRFVYCPPEQAFVFCSRKSISLFRVLLGRSRASSSSNSIPGAAVPPESAGLSPRARPVELAPAVVPLHRNSVSLAVRHCFFLHGTE